MQRILVLTIVFQLASSEPILKQVAVVGERIAEGTADFVVDLLCGCGCRHFEVRACKNDTKQVCKEAIDTRCRNKQNVECKEELKESCKTIQRDVCKIQKKKVCKNDSILYIWG